MHFIGHLIPAMTDSAPNPKRFHSPFHVGGLTVPQLACFKGGLTNIYDLMWSHIISSHELFERNRFLEPAYLLHYK